MILCNVGQRKKAQVLFGFFILFIVTINLGCFILIQTQPAPPLLERPQAKYGSVPIQSFSDTEQYGYIDDNQISMAWFLHVSDLHLETEANSSTSLALGQFLNFSYNQIHPLTVIVTGDQVKGQRPDNWVNLSGRVEQEWKTYFEIANKSPFAADPNPYRYIETAGNHDRNADWNAQYFLNYTLAGRKLGTIQSFFSINLSYGKTLFSILDSSPYLAPPAPLGSEGNLDQDDVDEYTKFLLDNEDAEHIFSFQHHHPLECFGLTSDPSSGLFKDISAYHQQFNVDAVFYGHAHSNFVETYGDVVYLMGDRFGDKYNTGNGIETQYYYHIVAIDSGGVNYINVPFSDIEQGKPHILITNPSNGLFLDNHDSIANTRGDGHIRALIFTNETTEIKGVAWQIDDGEWNPMLPYLGTSKLLYESQRGLPSDPMDAIPDDNKNHIVRIRVEMEDGAFYYSEASVDYQPIRKPWWQIFVLLIIIGVISIVIKDNSYYLPFERTRFRFKRISYAEKNSKRKAKNAEKNRPWWFPMATLSIILCFLLLPWAIFPINQGYPGIIYSLFYYTGSFGPTFTFETLLYTALIPFVVIPLLIAGTRNYNPEKVNLASILLLLNCAFVIWEINYDFGIHGMILPAIFFYISMGLVILIRNFRNTIGYRLLRKKFKTRAAMEGQ